MKTIISLLLIVVLVSGCGQKIDGNMSEQVQPFSFTNQDQEVVSLEDLKGNYWIANTIFTSCTTVCPPMTGNMSRLQRKMKQNSIEGVQLVSFSIDPKVDTPSRLKEFGDKFQADYNNWDFLTGYTFKEIKRLSIKSFKNLVDKTPQSEELIHGTSFYLVDPTGKVIKRYNGLKAEQMDVIIEDLNKVL